MRRSVLVVVACVAGMLVPSLSAPARTVTHPDVLSRSTTARAGIPARFGFPATHVVLSWTGDGIHEIRYRAIATDGSSGPWRTAHEAHDVVDGDTHYSGVLDVGYAAAVEWMPHSTRRSLSAQPIDVFYMNTEDGPLVSRTIPATAAAAASTPDVVTRAEWGADESLKSTSGGCDRDFYDVQQLFVHHTAGSNSATDYEAMMRAIYEFHTEGRGWCDLGYNFVIAPDGTVFEGRWARSYSDWEIHNSENRTQQAVSGAHVANHNSGSVGISMMGDFTHAHLTASARSSLVDVLAWEADRHDLDPQSKHTYVNPSTGETRKLPRIAGHRDAGSTACPGTTIYKDLPDLRADVAALIGTGKTSTALTMKSSAKKVESGDPVTLTGTFTAGGTPMAGRTIEFYERRGAGKWRLADHLVTGVGGTYTKEVRPTKNSTYEVRFIGDSSLWDSASPRAKVRVKPIVALSADRVSGGEEDPAVYTEGERVGLSGTVEPAVSDRRVKVKIFRRRNNGSEKLEREKKPRLEDGVFDTRYRMRKTDKLYRIVAWYPKGGGYIAARSEPVFVTSRSES